MINFVGNNVDKVSKKFLDPIVDHDRYLGLVPRKTLIGNSLMENTDIFSARDQMTASEKEKQTKFYNNIESLFKKITDLVDNK